MEDCGKETAPLLSTESAESGLRVNHQRVPLSWNPRRSMSSSPRRRHGPGGNFPGGINRQKGDGMGEREENGTVSGAEDDAC